VHISEPLSHSSNDPISERYRDQHHSEPTAAADGQVYVSCVDEQAVFIFPDVAGILSNL